MADYADPQYPRVVNPLDNLTKAVELNSLAQRNKLIGQELQGNTGLASAYAGSVGPDGNVDPNKLMRAASGAGIRAPEVIQAAQGMQLTAQQIQQQQLATQRAKMSMMAAAVAPIAKPGSTPADFISSSNDLIQNSNGLITKQDLMPIYSAFAGHLANGGSTPEYAQKVLGQLIAGGGDVKTGMGLMNGGDPMSMHTGGGTTTGLQNQVTGAFTPTSYIPDTLPATTQTVDPDTGAKNFVGGTGPSVPVTPGASPLAGAFGTQAAGGKPTGGGPAMAELPPGQAESMAVPKVAGAQQLVTDRAAAGNSINTLTNMHMAYNALQNADTGRGSGEINDLKNFAIWADPTGKLADSDFGKKTVSYDTAVSTLNDQARQLASQFGPKTNDNLDATFMAKPNVEQTKGAALALQQKIMSLTRANYAKTMFHDYPTQGIKTGNVNISDTSPGGYQGYSENFNRIVDPAAFGADLMSPKDLAEHVKDLSKTPDKTSGLSPYDRFRNGYNLASSYGFLDHSQVKGSMAPPPQPQAAQPGGPSVPGQ